MAYEAAISLPEETSSDEGLWRSWKAASGYRRQQLLEQLLDRFMGSIMSAVRAYQAAPLPYSVLQTEGVRVAAEAFEKFDPKHGVALSTYVHNYVRQRLNRYVIEHQNIARIPEYTALQIGALRQAEQELAERLQRPPTTDEIADHMGISVKQVARIRKSQRTSLLEGSLDADTLDTYMSDRNFERVMLAYYALTPEEKLVFDYSLGAHGQPRLPAAEIAKKLGVSNARISQLRASLARKIQPYLL